MAKKRPPGKSRKFKKLVASIAKQRLARSAEPRRSRFRHWPTVRITESLADKKQRLKELRKADPNWRLWGIGQASAVEAEAARLGKEIEEMEVERIRRNKNRPPVAAVEPDSSLASSENAFKHSDDFRTIHFKGERHELTAGQAQVVGFLFKSLQAGNPEVHKDRVLEELGTRASRLRDTFRGSPLWKKFIVRGQRKGTYRLIF